MKAKTRARLFQIASFVLAGLLLFFALRGVDAGHVLTLIREANYWWLLPLVAVTLLSHWIRSIRWVALLQALEDDQGRAASVPVMAAFSALMIGYLVNYAAPRFGEVVRTGFVSRRQHIAFGSVLGTVAVERIVDVISLGVVLGSSFVMFPAIRQRLWGLFVEPITSMRATPGLAIAVAGFVVLAVVLVVWFARLSRSVAPGSPAGGRVFRAVRMFTTGLASIRNSPRKATILWTTITMWVCYWVMTHLPFLLLNLDEEAGLTLAMSWVILGVSAVGTALPAPGGTGSYHYLAIQALVVLYGVAHDSAAAYAVITHAASLVLYAVAGALLLTFGAHWLGRKGTHFDSEGRENDD